VSVCIFKQGWTALVFLVCGLTVVACQRMPRTAGAEATSDRADKEVIGWLDRVEGKPRMGGSIYVVGWAASVRPERSIEKVEIFLDGIEVAETAGGVDRPDVADRFGNPSWARSGWESGVLLEQVLPGDHKIEAVARDNGGGRHQLKGACSIRVLE